MQTIKQKASDVTLSTKISTTAASTAGTQSSTALDHEGVTNWQIQHSRTIDLEGIREDGFGYTVTITGPPRRRNKLLKSHPSLRKNAEDGLVSRHSTSRNDSNLLIPLKVKTEKTFQVTETFQVPGRERVSEKSSRWGSISQVPDAELEEEIERAANGLGLKEWGDDTDAHVDLDDHFGPGTARL